jgi:hypothetical protein
MAKITRLAKEILAANEVRQHAPRQGCVFFLKLCDVAAQAIIRKEISPSLAIDQTMKVEIYQNPFYIMAIC